MLFAARAIPRRYTAARDVDKINKKTKTKIPTVTLLCVCVLRKILFPAWSVVGIKYIFIHLGVHRYTRYTLVIEYNRTRII